MEFDIKAIIVVILVTIISFVVLALTWLSLRQPSYEEVVANQSHKLKFFDSLGSSKKKEKVDKKAKKDKAKPKGKKKETSEDEETSNQTDEHSEAADNSPVIRKHKQQELHAEPHATPKAAGEQQAAVKSAKGTPVVQKSAVANEKPKAASAVESPPKETKVKSEPVKLVGESPKDAKSDSETKNAKKEKKRAKQGENAGAVKDADVGASAVAVGNSDGGGASASGKKPTKEHATPTKRAEEKIEAQQAHHNLTSPADGKKKTGAESKNKKADSAAASNVGVGKSAYIGQEGLQWVQSVTQMELSADQKNILDDVLNKSPANQKAESESQRREDKPAAGAGTASVEHEQLKATVAKLRQDIGEERRKCGELEKQAKQLAAEAAHVPQLVSEGKTLRLQIEGLTRQQSDAVLAVQRLREENRQLKEAGSVPRADDGTKMQLKLQMEEMSKLTLRLNTAENAKHNLEAKAARLDEQLQQTLRDKLETERLLREDAGRLQMQCAASAKDAERHQMQLRKAHQDCEKLQHERDAAWQQVEVNKEAEIKLQSTLADRLSSDDQVKQLRERNHELEVERQKHEADLLQLTEVNVKLSADFSSVRQKIVDLEKQVAESAQQKQLENVQTSALGSGDERQIQQLSSEISRLQTELDQQKEKSKDDSKLSQLQSDLQKKTTELDNRSKEVSTLREEINSLKNAQSQASVQLSELQSQLHRRDGDVKNLQLTVDDLQKQLVAEKQHVAASQDAQSKLAEAESRLAQRQTEIDSLKSVVLSLQQAAQSAVDSGDNSDALGRLSVTEQENIALLAQVAQYKTVLESTEGILKRLQASVETEERLWKEKVENAESVLQQIRSDNHALESELNTLRTTHEKTKAELGGYKSQAKQNGSASIGELAEGSS